MESGMKSNRAKVSKSGRLSIPSEIRKAIGLEHGGNVVVELAGNEIRIRTVAEAIARAQELTHRLLAGQPGTSVDDFIAERRKQAEDE
jgi:AbrB family looped-hinge helix DNA binding protein